MRARGIVTVHRLPVPKARDDRRLVDVTMDEIVSAVIDRFLQVVDRDPDPEVLTTQQLCERFHVSKDTVYKWVEQGCPHFRVGVKDYRFRFDQVLAWKEERGDE